VTRDHVKLAALLLVLIVASAICANVLHPH